ncbi:hypothetical protein EVAR_63044_1 [Eumeta japonica]|uniref:Uncharacterized protein n=1 Tax=Eumeta variegata TaxID=151549 RepID=A0A4C1YZM2_EUMVA|nr:hypothetical protein EVAR_63044_1 [Eumeta japonica]
MLTGEKFHRTESSGVPQLDSKNNLESLDKELAVDFYNTETERNSMMRCVEGCGVNGDVGGRRRRVHRRRRVVYHGVEAAISKRCTRLCGSNRRAAAGSTLPSPRRHRESHAGTCGLRCGGLRRNIRIYTWPAPNRTTDNNVNDEDCEMERAVIFAEPIITREERFLEGDYDYYHGHCSMGLSPTT